MASLSIRRKRLVSYRIIFIGFITPRHGEAQNQIFRLAYLKNKYFLKQALRNYLKNHTFAHSKPENDS
jgi:hypothetical protein